MSAGGTFNASIDALKAWYDEEVVLHDYSNAAYQGASGHMTQVGGAWCLCGPGGL